jgi:hypothetical protein
MKFKGCKIRGKLRTYDCRVKRDLMGFPRIDVYEMRPARFLFIKYFGWKKVWKGKDIYPHDFLTPNRIRNEAADAVNDYEEWKLAWEAEHVKQLWEDDTQ